MKRICAAVVGLVALGIVDAAAATSWADKPGDAGGAFSYKGSKAICRAVQGVALPMPDGPPAPQGCSSEVLYYGIGRPADPEAARRCAMAERAKDPDNDRFFAGTAMLVTMFANGRGAPRDLDVATALACTLDGAPAEMDGRVTHLAALKANGPGKQPFSICDDITSGLAQGECAAHESAIASETRKAKLAAMATSWTPAQKQSFAALQAAAEAFAKARGGNEIDLSGTGRGAFEIEAEDGVRDEFLAVLRGETAGAARPSSPEAEDVALNTAYRAVMAVADPPWGTPTKEGIKTTQRLWLTYRDRLKGFVADLKGTRAADVAVASLTHRRTLNLRELLSD